MQIITKDSGESKTKILPGGRWLGTWLAYMLTSKRAERREQRWASLPWSNPPRHVCLLSTSSQFSPCSIARLGLGGHEGNLETSSIRDIRFHELKLPLYFLALASHAAPIPIFKVPLQSSLSIKISPWLPRFSHTIFAIYTDPDSISKTISTL